jgi:hypothetical protein
MENNRRFRRPTSRWTARGPSAPLDRWARVSALIVGAAASVLLASVSTSANAAEDTTRIGHACATVMGLDPLEEPYQDCVRSLDRTLSRLKRLERSESSRNQCVKQGLDPGTAAFNTCVVQAEQVLSGSGPDAAVVPAR